MERFFNLEDNFLQEHLLKNCLKLTHFAIIAYSLNASIQLYNNASDNIFSFLSSSSYRKRNDSDEIINDTLFCLKPKIISK